MKKIGKYRVTGLLGRGGMGRVYKVEHPLTGKTAALKLLDPNPFLLSILGQKEIEKVFTSEAVTMANLRHPNIVEVFDFDIFEGKPYYIMEYYSNNLGDMIGETYETERPSRKIGLEKALYYTRQILSGLSRLHFSSIIHRDIKPFNILVTDYDIVKICDFGLSKLRNETSGAHKSLKIGTPYYASPEQEADPDNVGFTSDLYSAGVILFRMVTGRLPEGDDKNPLLYNSDLDQSWEMFMKKALSGDPAKRYESAEAMNEALDALKEIDDAKKAEGFKLPPLVSGNKKRSLLLRSKPLKVSRKEAANIFKTDKLMRPAGSFLNSFSTKVPELVHDELTGLVWQQGGTKFPLNHKEAEAYIEELNRSAFCGITSWRLPTVNEILSLIKTTPEGSCGIKSVFDRSQKWLWSSDLSTFISGWYVSLELGYAARNDFSAYCHVKAVSG